MSAVWLYSSTTCCVALVMQRPSVYTTAEPIFNQQPNTSPMYNNTGYFEPPFSGWQQPFTSANTNTTGRKISAPPQHGRRQTTQPGMSMRRAVRSTMIDRERQMMTANGPRRFQRTNTRGSLLNNASGDNTPSTSTRPTVADVAVQMTSQQRRERDSRHGNSNHTESSSTPTATAKHSTAAQLTYFEEENSANSAASSNSPTNNTIVDNKGDGFGVHSENQVSEDDGSCFGQRSADQQQPIIERAEEYNHTNRRTLTGDDDNGYGTHSIRGAPQPDHEFRPYDSQSQYSYYQHFYKPNQRNKNLLDMLNSMKLRSTGREKQRKAEDSEIVSSPIFYSFVRPCAAEFLGTIIYVYFTSFGRPLSPRPSEIICIGVMRAVSTLMSMLVLGHISGGHFNPAITLASWLSGGTRTVLAVFYIFVQFFGAFIGSLLFRMSVTYQEYDDLMGGMTYVPVRPPNARLLEEEDNSQPTRLQAVLLEIIISYVLCLAYVLSMVDTDGRCATDGPLSTAGAILLGTMAAYSTTRASMNPAKSFCSACVFAIFRPDLISWDYHYIYWIGPLTGAIAAAVSYRCLLASDDYRVLFTRDLIKSEDDNESHNKIDANDTA